MPEPPRTHCVVAVPEIGVSTPQAFRDWDAKVAAAGLTSAPKIDTLPELRLVYSSLSAPTGVSLDGRTGDSKFGTSGIVRDQNPEKKRDLPDDHQVTALNDLA